MGRASTKGARVMQQAQVAERRGRGRPPKGAPKAPKAVTVCHSFTPDGIDLISRLAARLGMSQSALLELAARKFESDHMAA